MGKFIGHKPVKLFVSVIYKDESFLKKAEASLVEKFGKKEVLEETFDFNYTDYYTDEMGEDLQRKVLCFEKLIDPDGIEKIKTFTNDLEDKLRVNKKRTVNIDPGYVTEAKLVLFTTKDYSHRIYLGNKIFAEVTLYFQNNSFRSWPWSYPDYSSSEMVDYLNRVRASYVEDVKNSRSKN